MMKIGKYEILEEIGRGAMGVVYKAFDPLIGREVAIKVISENALALPEIKERFYREARSVGKLNHENITIVHDVGEVDGKPYLVMEYLAGTDLKLIIREKTPLRLLQKLEYARQICEGLQYAHTHHVTHRDIKPENIKILPGGNIKIMDFGIARPAGSDLTAPGMMLGTPWYMSPEQIKGKIVDIRTDIFSFGVVLFELLMYKKPFEGNVSTVIYSIMHDEPAALSLESNLVADLQNLLAKCLAKNAEERYGDCAALLTVLDTIIAKGRQPEQKIIRLLAQAKALIAQQKFFEAMTLLEEILLIDLTFAEAQSLRQQCLEKIKTTAATPRMSKNMAGTIISHYKIIARLGVGGMGVVYKAEDTRLKRLVALKFLSPHLTADAVAKERFIREAQAASALDHPNICTIYEIDETAASPDLQFTEGLGQLFICMAYYAGQTLKEKMVESGLPLGQTMNIVVQIAQGLAKAHENGIVHRDIKPANIMITKDGLVKILDFGLAKLTGETRLTRSGVTAGTLSYLSPEQAQNQEVDHRSDIWSLGVMLYQMTTGKLPFDGEYDLAILYSIVNKDPTPATQLNSNIPAELEQVISRALQKPPYDRYASMQKMLDDLKRAERRADKMKEPETAPLLEEVGSLIAKGKFFLGKDEIPEALSRFKAALAIDAKNSEVPQLIATCERKQKEVQQINNWLDMAKKQFEKGAYDDSLNTIQTILALDPNHTEAQDWAKKNQQCLEKSEKVEKFFSDAEFYLKKEKFAQAREVYQEILELAPANKNAARGLERAEKGLQSRDARPSQITLLETIDQTPTSFRGKPKLSGKRLWLGVATVVLIGVVGVWFLWFRSNSQIPPEPSGSPLDFSQRATDTKQEMLKAKTEAEQASAERWAPETYQQALQEEQRGNDEFSQGNFASAWRAYNAAMEKFGSSTEEAKTKTEAASLNEIIENAAHARQAMLKEKKQAEEVGAKTNVRELFDKAFKKEQEGDKSFDRDDRDGYLAAQKSYAEAMVGYKKAGDETAFAKLADEAETARKDMDAAKQQISGSEEEKNANSNYEEALKLETAGNKHFEAGRFRDARKSFGQARDYYVAAAKDMAINMGRSGADAAKATMQEARAKVGKESYADAKYSQAERFRGEADNDYNARHFDGAATKYKKAETLYVDVAREREAQLAGESRKLEAAKQAIEALIAAFEQRLERRDYNGFKALFKDFKQYENLWSAFFRIARDIKVEARINNIVPSGGQAKVDIEVNINFYNIDLGKSEDKPMGPSWTLEQINDKWVIVTLGFSK